jgi:hypothetical protein
VHNVLKGARTMSPGSADRLMRALGLSARDLFPESAAAPVCATCGHPSPKCLRPVNRGRATEPLLRRSPELRPPSYSS